MAMKRLIIEFGQGIALNGKPKTEITIAIVALTVYVDA
mgnify:CR=1 FL=1